MLERYVSKDMIVCEGVPTYVYKNVLTLICNHLISSIHFLYKYIYPITLFIMLVSEHSFEYMNFVRYIIFIKLIKLIILMTLH